MGTSESTEIRSGGTSTPSSWSSHNAPSTYVAHSGTRSLSASPDGATVTVPEAWAETTDQPSSASSTEAVQPIGRAIGRTKPSL